MVPLDLAGSGVEREHARGVEVVARMIAAVPPGQGLPVAQQIVSEAAS
jgi:hypothetical protein